MPETPLPDDEFVERLKRREVGYQVVMVEKADFLRLLLMADSLIKANRRQQELQQVLTEQAATFEPMAKEGEPVRQIPRLGPSTLMGLERALVDLVLKQGVKNFICCLQDPDRPPTAMTRIILEETDPQWGMQASYQLAEKVCAFAERKMGPT